MAGLIVKPVLKKVFGETLENMFGTADPFFEQVPATRLDGTPTGKFKKVQKALPPGISEHDSKVLTKVKRRAYRLDASFSFCGIRVGYGSILGLFPGFGDVVDALLALMVVHTCKQVEGGLPFWVKLQLYFWVLLDFLIGIIPVIGDFADAVVRANCRNAIILEDHLREKGIKNLRKSGLPVPEVDPSDPEVFDRRQHESRRVHVSSQSNRHQDMSADNTQNSHHPARPEAARVHVDQKTGGGFFGFCGSKKSQPADVEMGSVNTGPARKSFRRH